MAAPIFIGSAVADFATIKGIGVASANTSTTFAVLAGDVIVALAASDDQSSGALTPSDGSNSYSERVQRLTALHCGVDISTAGAAGSATLTGTITRAGTAIAQNFGAAFLVFRGSDGIGPNVLSVDAQTGSLTTTQDNSAVALVIADWNASSAAGKTWPTINGAQPVEVVPLAQVAGQYTYVVAYYADVGLAGPKTIELTAPALGTPRMLAIEVKGSSSVGSKRSRGRRRKIRRSRSAENFTSGFGIGQQQAVQWFDPALRFQAGGGGGSATGSASGAWSVRNGQTGSASGAWSVRNAATATKAGAWSVRNAATSSQAGAWSIRNVTIGSLSGAWSVRNAQAATKAGAWSVRNAQTGSYASAWSVRNAAPVGAFSGAWSIQGLNNATGSFSGAWSVAAPGNAVGSYSSAWSVRGAATGLLAGAWSVRNSAQGSRSDAWSIRNSSIGAAEGAWSVRGAQTGSASGAWSVRGQASATQTGAWSVRNSAQGSYSGAWSVDSTISNQTGAFGGAWSVRNAAQGSFSGAWSIEGEPSELPDFGGGDGNTRIIKRLRRSSAGMFGGSWSVRGAAQGHAGGAWSVRNSAEGEFGLSWSVLNYIRDGALMRDTPRPRLIRPARS